MILGETLAGIADGANDAQREVRPATHPVVEFLRRGIEKAR